MESSKVIVFDGGNILHRAIFAYRVNPSIPATYTYCRMLIGDLKKVGASIEDLVIIAMDYGKSWRKDIDKSYKAQRKAGREAVESPEWWKTRYEEFNVFIPNLEKAVNWQFVKVYRIEADDIAAIACKYYKNNEVILISSDKDWEMLVSYPNVRIFSPISKKYKNIPNPMKVLLDKIQGDISDNLLEVPSSEAEFERRKKIVDLINLPNEIEQPILAEFSKLLPKNLYLQKIPYNSVRVEVKKLYNLT